MQILTEIRKVFSANQKMLNHVESPVKTGKPQKINQDNQARIKARAVVLHFVRTPARCLEHPVLYRGTSLSPQSSSLIPHCSFEFIEILQFHPTFSGTGF